MRPVRRRLSHPGFGVLHAAGAVCFVALGAAWGLPVSGLVIEPTDGAGGTASEDADGAEPTGQGLEEAVVVLSTGREVSGLLIEQTERAVVLRINGIDTTFQRERIAGVRVLAPLVERYRALRGTVEDTDVRARLALVEWLRAREAYRLALDELEGILEVDPNHPDALTLHRWLKNHLELAAESSPRVRPAVSGAPAPAGLPTLTEEQINLIRVYEFDLGSETRLLISDDTMRELMVRYPESFPADLEAREDILDLEPAAKLRTMFELRARDQYGEVRVLEDPPTMATFKSRVHAGGGWLVNACASNRCHGGVDSGRLRLINDRPTSDATTYTNFIILERFRMADGTSLLNYEEPDRSPLLHMALPRRASLYPHPEVDSGSLGQDWRFVFRSTSDRGFQESAGWIGSLYTPRPDYGIEYPPPSSSSNPGGDSQPAERPGPGPEGSSPAGSGESDGTIPEPF